MSLSIPAVPLRRSCKTSNHFRLPLCFPCSPGLQKIYAAETHHDTVGCIIIGMWSHPVRSRRERDQANHEQHLRRYRSSAYTGRITRVKQNARTGIKAYVQWRGTNSSAAMWVRGERVYPGQHVVLTGSCGCGDHHAETVFYVDCLVDAFDHQCSRSARRHERRIAKAHP